MPGLHIKLFGDIVVTYGQEPIQKFRTTKAQALLAYLAADATHVHQRDHILDLLWPGLPQKSARTNLRQVLYQIRSAIPEVAGRVAGQLVPLMVSDNHMVRINPEAAVTIDSAEFERHLDAVYRHEHSDVVSCPTCLTHLTSALDLYDHHFLTTLYIADSNTFEDWLLVKREAFERRYLDALALMTRIHLAHGRYAAAEAVARQQLSHDNLRESAHRQLLEALARNGQRNEAIGHFEQLRRLLSSEMGMSPSQKTAQLAEAIARDELDMVTAQSMPVRGYELLEQLGEGSFGSVNRAYQPLVNREVAVKIIKPAYANRPNFIRRFEHEAQTVARLEHPHIVPIYDFWREPDRAYLVMRYLRGGTLRQAIGRDDWTAERAIAVGEQIASALATAHRQGVIHRDVNPNNILLDEQGNAYLSDFGIARSPGKRTEGDSSDCNYQSPEQQRGERLTERTDVYSLGVTLKEALCQQKDRFNGQLTRVLDRATADEPTARFDSAPALIDALREATRIEQESVAVDAILTPAIDENPYRGLRAFQEGDAEFFFGRNSFIKRLTDRLESSRFLAVVGPSGSGKSSVVKAGLIPQLRRGAVTDSEKWFVTEMVPGTHPLEELEAALMRVAVDPPVSLLEPLQKDERGLVRVLKRILPHTDAEQPAQLLLVIDQFEELFTLVDDEERRQHFVDNLLAALSQSRSQLRIVVTLRADFYDRPLQMSGLAEWMQANTEAIVPLDAAALEQAVEQPALLAGVRYEEGLVARIVDDVRGQAGMLPLLQFALTELFEQRRDGLISAAAYEQSGGVVGVLGQRAEAIYGRFSAENKSLSRQLFLRLVTLGEGVEDTRRRVLVSELESLNSEQEQSKKNGKRATGRQTPYSMLLTPFGEARLLSFDRDPLTRTPTVEVAHEALLREWPRLRAWLEESREELRLQRRLGVISAEYSQSSADPSFLLRGGQLEQFEEWAAQTTIALTSDERTFLNASVEARAKQLYEEEIRQQRELKQAQKLAETERHRASEQQTAAGRLRQRALLLAGALAIAAMLAIVAFIFGQRATINANLAATREVEAQEQTRLATARELSAHVATNLSEDSQLSLLLAMKSLEIAHTYEGEAALHLALQTNRLRKTIKLEDGFPSLREGPQGLQVFVRPSFTGTEKLISVWDASTGDRLYNAPYFGEITSVNRDGTQFSTSLCTTLENRMDTCTLRVYDMLTGAEIAHPITRELRVDQNDVAQFWVHPDWEHIVWGMNDGRIIVENIQSGSIVTLANHSVTISGIGFSETTAQMVSSDLSGRLILWDLEDTSTTNEVPIITEWQTSAGVSAHVADIGFAIYERAGETFVVTLPNSGNSVSVWAVKDGSVQLLSQQKKRLVNTITDFAVNSDGSMIASVSHDGFVRVSDVHSGENLFDLTGNRISLIQIAFINNDSQLLGVSQDSEILIWDASPIQNEVRALGRVPGMGGKVSVDATGRYAAMGSLFESAIVYDLESGEEHWRLPISLGSRRVSFHPDGKRIAAAGHDGIIRIHDLHSGAILDEWQAHKGGPPDTPEFWAGTWGLTFNPAGTFIASSGDDGLGKVWDVNSGELMAQFEFAPSHRVLDALFSPDGKLLAFHGGVQGVDVYDVSSYDGATMERLWRFDDVGYGLGLAFSPDSSKLVASADKGRIAVWDMASGEKAYDMPTLISVVPDVIFTPDGAYLIVADGGGTVVWDAHTGHELFELTGPGLANEIDVTPQGRLIAGDFLSGNVAEFTIYLEDARALAQERLTREMTEAECLQYLRNADCEVSFEAG